MIIFHNKVIGLPLVSAQDDKKIGAVKGLVINPENGKFLGLIVSRDKLFGGKNIALIEDIKKIDDREVIIKNENSLHSPDCIEDSIKQIKIKNNKVITKSGDSLGEVRNFAIDLNYDTLSKIYVSGGIIEDLIRGELIIPWNQIISIKKDAITVRDIIIKSKETRKLISREKKLTEAGLFIKLNS
jgi:uncharacterized protein YrrD